MKKVLITSLLLLTLTGCATNRQNAELLGGITGAAAGKSLGGTGGAIIGAAVGAAAAGSIGQRLDENQAPPVPPQVVSVAPNEIIGYPPPTVVYVQPWYRAPGPYWYWSYHSNLGWGWYHPRHHHFHHRPRHHR